MPSRIMRKDCVQPRAQLTKPSPCGCISRKAFVFRTSADSKRRKLKSKVPSWRPNKPETYLCSPARTARFFSLYAWTGPADIAREHGEKALALAQSSSDKMLAWTAHWGMGLLAGLTSDAPSVAAHIAECEKLEEQLKSPLLPLWTAELSLQYASGVGDWNAGIATGERTIALAQALGQKILLPRLLVWTGLIYLWRSDLPKAKSYFDRAWDLSGAAKGEIEHADVPTVVPAHMGLAAYHLETDDLAEAIESAKRDSRSLTGRDTCPGRYNGCCRLSARPHSGTRILREPRSIRSECDGTQRG